MGDHNNSLQSIIDQETTSFYCTPPYDFDVAINETNDNAHAMMNADCSKGEGDIFSYEEMKWNPQFTNYPYIYKQPYFNTYTGEDELSSQLDYLASPESLFQDDLLLEEDEEEEQDEARQVFNFEQKNTIGLGISLYDNNNLEHQVVDELNSDFVLEQGTRTGKKFELIQVTESDILHGQKSKPLGKKPQPPVLRALLKKNKKTRESGKVYVPILGQFLRDHQLLESMACRRKKGRYRCTHCNLSFTNLIDYISHIDFFEIDRKFKCNEDSCSYKLIGFARGAELKRHFETQHCQSSNKNDDDFKGKLTCGYENCHKSFPRRDSLKRHEKLCHLNQQSRFNTRKNGKVVGNKRNSKIDALGENEMMFKIVSN